MKQTTKLVNLPLTVRRPQPYRLWNESEMMSSIQRPAADDCARENKLGELRLQTVFVVCRPECNYHSTEMRAS